MSKGSTKHQPSVFIVCIDVVKSTFRTGEVFFFFFFFFCCANFHFFPSLCNRFLKAACDSQTSSVGGFSPSIGEDEEKGEEESKHPTPISLATPMVTPSYATRDALISEEFPIAKKQDIRLCGWLTTNEKVLVISLMICIRLIMAYTT